MDSESTSKKPITPASRVKKISKNTYDVATKPDKKVKLPEVKIDCYTLNIKKHKNIKSGRDTMHFDDFFRDSINRSNSDNNQFSDFIGFFKNYISSFDGKFAVNGIGKAIHLQTEKINLNSANRIISGIIEGGTTNMGGFIKEQGKTRDEDSFILTPNHVEGQPFYFLLYFPQKSNIAVLLIQSFSSKSITDVFKSHLTQFFNKATSNHSLSINTIIPKQIVKSFKEKGTINTITLRKQNLDSDKASRVFGIEYKSETGITMELKISGLRSIANAKEVITNFMDGDNTMFYDIPGIAELGFEGKFEKLIEYEHNGKISSIRSSQNFDFHPSFYVDEADITRDIQRLPTHSSLDKYCRSLLLTLCQDISLTTPNVS